MGNEEKQKLKMLGTARVTIQTENNEGKEFRALCDNGSQVNLVTMSAVRRLNLRGREKRVQLVGINGKSLGQSLGCVRMRLKYPNGETREDEFIIVKNLTDYAPKHCERNESLLQGLKLADECFNQPGEIELLLGLGMWINITKNGIRKNREETILAQNTKLGWVIFQEIDETRENYHIGNVTIQESVDDVICQVGRFLGMESVNQEELQWADVESIWSKQEKACEEYFVENYYRTEEGRYVVRLPFNEKINELGRSKYFAIKQFENLEKRMDRDKEFAQKYVDFMKDYEKAGHMSKIGRDREEGYYTVHHGIRSSGKFRVIYDASRKTTTQISLNEAQLVGPRQQRDIFVILNDFRIGKFGLTADIVQMYRQILVDERDRKFQKIIWRSSRDEPISVYELNTVTYGHAAAPHCAIRAMNQCAQDYENQFQLGARIVKNNFYVDDLIVSCNSELELEKIKQELTELLGRGCFTLAKWRSNLNGSDKLDIQDKETKAVLGLLWDTKTDEFRFAVKEDEKGPVVWTKRNILSKLGRIFDPLGLITPITLVGKIMMQELWKSNVGWDEPVSTVVNTDWKKLLGDLSAVNRIKVPRWVKIEPSTKCQIHGFCDASKKAYGAVVYVRVSDLKGNFYVTLLSAKSRVAPIKELTIPRLELCATLLLMDLIMAVLPAFDRERIEAIHCWSDSQISLYWIHGGGRKESNLKVFVANRVNEVVEKTKKLMCDWHWISGKENPADLASRGVMPTELVNSKSWWMGPAWLKSDKWPNLDKRFEITERERGLLNGEIRVEKKKLKPAQSVTLAIHHATMVRENESMKIGPWYKTMRHDSEAYEYMDSFSDFKKLKLITAMLFRACHNFKFPRERVVGSLTSEEKKTAVNWLIRYDQANTVTEEIETLKGKKGTNLTFKFDEEEKILRVIGRLENANLTKDEINPIYLSPEGKLIKLLIQYAHKRTFHGGTQEMIQFLRSKYWVPGLRRMVRQVPLRCPSCFRQRMKTSTQQMASLPASRVIPAYPFENCGVDYAGPILVRSKYGRKPVLKKAWIAVFVCLVTRAVHLEIVTDATSVAFTAALRRIISRRGMIRKMVSDNGTNFVGAAKNLREIMKRENVESYEREFDLEWSFNPPSAPHHGGIFEAAVKSMKYHLIREIGDHALTEEEVNTLLCQIEACLNSRPLGALHDDNTNDLALTPAHFLVGRPLITLQEEDNLESIKISRLNRWQRIQQIHQGFWKKWKESYLLGLIKRSKWNGEQRNTQVGDVVVVRNENEPPTRWWLARIVQTYPGKDGLVRTVKITHHNREYVRPITKLGLLIPIEEQKI